MRIGITGAGNMGATLAGHRTRLGHQVAIANSRGPRTLAGLAARTDATPVPVTQVTSKVDVVIVAIPERSIPELPVGLLSALPEDTVVIDTGNYVPKLRDGHMVRGGGQRVGSGRAAVRDDLVLLQSGLARAARARAGKRVRAARGRACSAGG
jgi:predicted dinucleotide-binding enzyme